MPEPTDQPVTLTAREVALLHEYLQRADDVRPTTMAGEQEHYCALVQLHAVVALVLGGATERGDR